MSVHAATRAVRAAIGSDREHRAVVPPLHLSANFVFDAPGVCAGYDYSRTANTTRDHLSRAVAEAVLHAPADAAVLACLGLDLEPLGAEEAVEAEDLGDVRAEPFGVGVRDVGVDGDDPRHQLVQLTLQLLGFASRSAPPWRLWISH